MADSTTGLRRTAAFTLLELIVVISVMAVLASMGFASWKYIKRQVDIGATQTLVQAVAAAITNYGQKTFSWYDMDMPPAGSTIATVHNPPVQHVAFLWDLNSPNVVKPPVYSSTNTPDLPLNARLPGVNLRYDSIDGTPPDPSKPIDTSLSQGGGGITTDTGEPRDNRDGWIPGCSFFGNLSTNPTYVGLWYSGYRGFYDMCQPSIAKQFINSKHQPIDSWKQPLRIAFAANTYGAAWFGVWSAGPDLTDETADDIQSWVSHAAN